MDDSAPFFRDRQITRKTLKRKTSRVKSARSVIRLNGYLCAVFAGDRKTYVLDVAQIARSTGMGKRTVERAAAWIRANETRFDFRKRRVGEIYVVEIRDRQKRPLSLPLSPTPPIPRSLPSENSKHGGAGFGTAGKLTTAGAKKLNRLAGFIARQDLRPAHWENCKILWRFPHAWGYAAEALRRGYAREDIAAAYLSALRTRHGDATDCGANTGAAVSVRWEPSSTVTLAADRLGCVDELPDAVRVSRQLAALAPAKREAAVFAAKIRAELAAVHTAPASPA